MESFEIQARQLAAKGKTRGQIEFALVHAGLDQQSAEQIARCHGQPDAESDAGEGNVKIVTGILMVLLGLGITAVSYQSAAPGGTYVVTWGLVLAGVIRFFRGIANG